MSAVNLPVGKKRDGTTDLNKRGRSQELDYSLIVISPEQIDHARGVVAASSRDAADAEDLLTHLGLMPDQTDWYKNGDDS